MNKGKKIISTLAIASMLAGNVLPLASLAAINKMDSGIYTQADGTTKYVGLRIHKDDRTQSLTVQDVENKLGKTVTNYTDKTTVVGTGSEVTTADGAKYTVVLYGDVDGNGMVTSADASLIAESVVKTKTLTAPQAEAARVGVTSDANLGYDKEVTSKDASVIATYMVNKLDYVIDPMPESDPEQDVPATEYAMTVNENNVINNVNEANTTITLNKNVTLASGESLRLDVYYEKAENMLKEAIALSQKVTASTVSGKVTLSAKVGNISDFSTLDDGKLYFRLYKVTTNGDNTVDTLVSETVVEKTTDVLPQLAEVAAKRNSTNNVIFTGTRYGESDIKTIYYCAVPQTETGSLSWNKQSKRFTYTGTATYTPETFTIAVNGANSVNKTLTGLNTDTAYKLYYVLENEKGSQNNLTTLEFVEVAKDKNVVAEGGVTELKYHKETGANQFKFTWTAPTQGQQKGTKGYIVTVYDAQNNVVAVDSATTGEYTLDTTKVQQLGLGAGEYYITVVTKGDLNVRTTPTVDSAAVKSENTVKVGQIASIANLKYSINETTEGYGYPKLSWTENDQNCGGYELNLYQQNPTTGLFSKTVTTACTTNNVADKSIYFGVNTNTFGGGWTTSSSIQRLPRNYGYLVEVVAKADNTNISEDDDVDFYLDSEAETYYFFAPYRDFESTSIESSDKTVTLKLDKTTNVSPYFAKTLVYGAKEEDYQYEVRVYAGNTYVKTVTPTVSYKDVNDDGEIDETYFTIDNLAANTDYTFRLVTTCGEFDAWSEPTASIRTMPKIQGLTKAASEAACVAGSKTFFIPDTYRSDLIVEGTRYLNDDYPTVSGGNGATQLDDLTYFLGALNSGDRVTISGNNVNLELNTQSSNSNNVLNARYTKNKVITLTGSNYQYKLSTPIHLPKEVHIKSGQFDITALQVDNKDGVITLGNGSVVNAAVNQDLTIEAGAAATINGLKITSAKENVVRVTEKTNKNTTIEIVANNNTLTFENVSTKVNLADVPEQLTIKFVSEDGNNAVQQGSITIVNGEESAAKIVVTQENVTVEGGLTVNVEKGAVDVSDVNITASKAVTLSKDATITAVSEAAAPEELIRETVTIKNYANAEDLTAELKNDASKGYEITPEVLARVNTWLATFGINGKGATVEVGSQNKVTISYKGAETLTVTGLK